MLSILDGLVIDYDAPDPPSRQIAAHIRGAIEAGELQPGRKIPSETDIVQAIGAARTPARRAVGLLRAEGTVGPGPERGTYVTGREGLTGSQAAHWTSSSARARHRKRSTGAGRPGSPGQPA